MALLLLLLLLLLLPLGCAFCGVRALVTVTPVTGTFLAATCTARARCRAANVLPCTFHHKKMSTVHVHLLLGGCKSSAQLS
jgi:hypothetical protein